MHHARKYVHDWTAIDVAIPYCHVKDVDFTTNLVDVLKQWNLQNCLDYVASWTAVNSMAMFIYDIPYKFNVAIRLDARVQTAHVSSQDCWQCSQVRLPHLVGRCDDYQVHTCIRKTWRARGIFSFRVMDCCWRVWHCSFIMTKSSTSQRCVVYAVCWCINPRHCRRMVWKCPVWRCRW